MESGNICTKWWVAEKWKDNQWSKMFKSYLKSRKSTNLTLEHLNKLHMSNTQVTPLYTFPSRFQNQKKEKETHLLHSPSPTLMKPIPPSLPCGVLIPHFYTPKISKPCSLLSHTIPSLHIPIIISQ